MSIQAKLAFSTVANGLAMGSDLEYFYEGWDQSSAIDRIVEWAGRTCYKSNNKMGKSANFISARIAEEHEDIVEHGFSVVRLTVHGAYDLWQGLLMLKQAHKYLEFFVPPYVEDEEINVYVGGNTRTWLKFLRDERVPGHWRDEVTAVLGPTAPKCYAEFGAFEPHPDRRTPIGVNSKKLHSGAQVHLLGVCQSQYLPLSHHHATVMWEKVSRACTHQLVRQRLLSFSQESQRFCDFGKKGGSTVLPILDYLAEDKRSEALAVLGCVSHDISMGYKDLRSLGLRKEDARVLLPNAAASRIVISGTLEGWRHAFWLRCDKAAQTEIRNLSWHTLGMLERVWPGKFDDIREAYRTKEPS